MTIGNRISELRKAKGFTQEYIAQELGVSRQAVSKWEQDLTTPDTKNLIGLSALLGASIEFIATGNIQNQPNPVDCQITVRRINRMISAGNKQLIFGIVFLVLSFILGYLGLIPSIVLIVCGIINLSKAGHMSDDLNELQRMQKEENK